MIKKIVIKKNSRNTVTHSKDTKLSIQFNLDGFSFCIINNTTKETNYFSEYVFKEKQLTPENLLKKIEEIFKTDIHLQKDFSSVLVIHQNNLFSLVPNQYFSEDVLSEYLNFNIKTLATDFIAYDDIESINAKNVYVPYVNINNYLFQNFGEFEYQHHLTILIEKLISANNSDDKKVFVNVSKENYDIVVLENKQLQFSNSFNFQTKEDFIYYILFTFEQLKLDVEKIGLFFTGDIEPESEIYKITYQYIRNVSFLESNNKIFNELDASKHSNYILLNS
ncbi:MULTISPECIES: DUF3822 family protein [Polaribacter]|uniref:DUF3822 family protein n=1 Tax=Polaribacter sejongensis TaxID=985043 RepID=A0AAJ1VG65_9FLAO|nr:MULTISPECIES: DUF3822 family protein [Polaribacter]MDN3618042.1 DUF3822 family protein [Polaribacter undariae]UWD31926.1 DUF3822 family protein [Polaribacter undariae]